MRARILVVAPSGRDGELAHMFLTRAEFEVTVCANLSALCDEARRGVGVCVIAEEAFDAQGIERLADLLGDQPAWSDLPLIVITARQPRRLPQRRAARLDTLLAGGNVTFIERPLQIVSFTSTLKSALRARDRQYAAEGAILQRDGFLAMLSHELRNPLAAVVLGVEVLRHDNPDAIARHVHLERIARQARHLTRLVDDLLEVSRITSGRIILKQDTVDVSAMLTATINNVGAREGQRRVMLSMPKEAVLVRGDPVRLEQVFVNLLTNGLKYTPPPGRVMISVERVEADVRITFRDDGIGIAAEMLSRIFDMFVQADSALARSQGGMGIGLTLAKSLVELHGGRIEAASGGVGQGATFTVTLPMTQPVSTEADSDMPATSHEQRTIVVIEDSEDLRETMKTLLERAGHQIAVAGDGAKGLDLLLSTRPQVAFIDIGLPGLDGYAIARAARQRLGSSVTLVAVSGYGRSEDKARALEAGFDSHLTKPIDSRTLLRTATA
ncbi:MAG: ATP-binding protein [Myxococcota bacterium]